jgi:hypothetical protein
MITRRQFAGGLVAAAVRAAPRKPNVLFVSADDMNDWVGCLGGYPAVRAAELLRPLPAGQGAAAGVPG